MEHASPPRLMILKMVLENFKSYGGVKEIGPFHKCLSSVVGEEAACRFALTLDAAPTHCRPSVAQAQMAAGNPTSSTR